MQLDDRSNKFINELMSDPNIRTKDLEKKYAITRRQINYSFEKINDWLSTKNLPAIERTRQGLFIVDPIIFNTLSDKMADEIVVSKVLTEEERSYLIILMILSQSEELSIIHFTSALYVSKNTILNDLKKVQSFIERYSLLIRYSRKEGYLIEGEEFDIRRLLVNITSEVIEMNNGKDLIEDIAQIKREKAEEFSKRIERAENHIGLKFTDEKIEAMPYILLLIIRRIYLGKKVNYSSINYQELSDTKEAKATEEILFDIANIPTEEKLFITLHLLTSSVYWSEPSMEDRIPDLMSALEETISLFERNACIVIQDKPQLLNKLLLHAKPAYYRVKYNLTAIGEMNDLISEEFRELHHLVKKSLQPLTNLLGMEIPDNETIYLTMLIGGWLTKQGEKLQTKIKAIVVCPKGVSVSRLMYSELKELFPEFIFLDSLSVREFKNYTLEYDVVFSPVFLNTDKKLYIANSFLDKDEKYRLRKQVMNEYAGFSTRTFCMKDMKEIIEKHTTIHNEKMLTRDLYKYIHNVNDVVIELPETMPSYSLLELLEETKITLKNEVSNWEEAIKIAANPLLAEEKITPQYIEAMLIHCKNDPYIIIGKGLAIPHASSEDGVNEVSMSLLRIKRGVPFDNEHLVKIIVVIAAVDKQQHLKALMQLMDLSNNASDMQKIIQAEDTSAIQKIIEKYSNAEKEEK
ncbi:hypothetical protein Pryu01_01034 [Paraliobacillus ryukyuensis]|uniref:Ascorbate-specific PTS system EIIA component n=1 Tax=Paraliobacillus ryukyuensis TaxID=200904 RepID=A0A366EDB3_9BACI|nr:BglG family transcription antiterminator [Paraliobacillus ryukyuensis]RBP00394.1 BglG family transcriptional antiterminator [Paraliobacillus ryukyuensis]